MIIARVAPKDKKIYIYLKKLQNSYHFEEYMTKFMVVVFFKEFFFKFYIFGMDVETSSKDIFLNAHGLSISS